MNLVIDAYRRADVNVILSDPQNVRVVQLWIESHPEQVSHSPMLKDLKNRVYHLNAPIAASDIESKILAGRFQELKPEELVKNLKLIQTHLELKTLDLEKILPLLLDKLPTKELTLLLSSSLSEESIQRLSKSQMLRLSAVSNIRLPPSLQHYRHILQNKDDMSELTGLTEEEEDAALAHYIERHRISLCDIKLSDAEFLRLAPHLRYVDLKNFTNIPLAKELLKKCSNLNVLLLKNGEMIKNVSSLPLCQELNCEDCANLPALPELPLCEKLNCFGCISLPALPELPLCKMLNCSNCTNLPALPELPLCEELYCSFCTNLPALPELPLCEILHCYGCPNLRVLPELPLCELLSCWGCKSLTTLPLSLGQNAELTTIDINDTRIDPAVRDAILNQSRQMRDAEAVKILPSRLAKWKAIAKSDANLHVTALSDDQKKTLNEWLLRLERTKDFRKSQSLLAQTVCKILADLLKNKEFQELFFPQAEANNECCEDRAAMSLNEIYTSWMVMCKSGDLHMLTGVAKTLRLRKELQKLIGDERESVEIFLYYESAVKERLGLETAIQSMTYGEIGKRNWINEDKLVEDVDAHFFEELFELPAFQKRIVFDDSEFSDKLEALGECPKGDPNDESVLNYQHRQGEIMQEWKREKMLVANQWYKEHI